MSVLPKNRQLVFSIRNYIRDTSEIFSISSLVEISLTLFLCFSFVFLCFSSSVFSKLEDKLHMFAQPCNILYLIIIIQLKMKVPLYTLIARPTRQPGMII